MPDMPPIEGIEGIEGIAEGGDDGEADGIDAAADEEGGVALGSMPVVVDEPQPASTKPSRPTAATDTAVRRRGIKRAEADIIPVFPGGRTAVRRAVNKERSRRMRRKAGSGTALLLRPRDAHLEQQIPTRSRGSPAPGITQGSRPSRSQRYASAQDEHPQLRLDGQQNPIAGWGGHAQRSAHRRIRPHDSGARRSLRVCSVTHCHRGCGSHGRRCGHQVVASPDGCGRPAVHQQQPEQDRAEHSQPGHAHIPRAGRQGTVYALSVQPALGMQTPGHDQHHRRGVAIFAEIETCTQGALIGPQRRHSTAMPPASSPPFSRRLARHPPGTVLPCLLYSRPVDHPTGDGASPGDPPSCPAFHL